ncbi:hypothetical protein V6N13_112104 [Hibiscus sabdariffa]
MQSGIFSGQYLWESWGSTSMQEQRVFKQNRVELYLWRLEEYPFQFSSLNSMTLVLENVVDSDSKTVISKLRSSERDLSEIGMIIADVKLCSSTLHGVQFAIDMCFSSIQVDSDSKTVISKLRSSERDLSEIGMIIADVKLCSSTLDFCSFEFVGRNANKATHAMTIEGIDVSVNRFWVEEVPVKVLPTAEEDRCYTNPP